MASSNITLAESGTWRSDNFPATLSQLEHFYSLLDVRHVPRNSLRPKKRLAMQNVTAVKFVVAPPIGNFASEFVRVDGATDPRHLARLARDERQQAWKSSGVHPRVLVPDNPAVLNHGQVNSVRRLRVFFF